MKKIDIPEIFKSDADEIIRARTDAFWIHESNIRASGNEVETSVREYFQRMLPPRYNVSQGHLLEKFGNCSSQLDIIVSDNSTIPSLMTTKDGTRYIPIDSVYSIGEIKSTYHKNDSPIELFSKTIEDIQEKLYHPDIINTAYDEITDDTNLSDLVLGEKNRILNKIFSFAIFVDSGDFKFEDISPYYTTRDTKYLPNITVILDKGLICYAFFQNEKVKFIHYPDELVSDYSDWCFFPIPKGDSGSTEGNHLGTLYNFLLEHLTHSQLGPPKLEEYLSKLMVSKKSLIKKANN